MLTGTFFIFFPIKSFLGFAFSKQHRAIFIQQLITIYQMKNILVAIEFGEKASLLVQKTAELALKFSAKVWLIHIAAPEPDFVGYEVGPQYIRDSRAETLKEEHHLLIEYANTLKAMGLEAEGLLIQGATVDMIVEESEKLKADLVVIGHDEHSFLYDLFVGSTAAGVLKKSDVPLLIIPFSS
jgi:nucleotide-binding universal stress UspA family protein